MNKTHHRIVCGLTVTICGLAAVGVSAQATSLPSGAPVPSFDQLWMKVKSGDTVYVLDTSARETRGTFARVSPASIAVLVDGQIREIPLDDVRQVARRGDRLWNGALIGGVFGGVVGALPAEGYTVQDRVALSLIEGGVFAAIGAGIDALIHGRTVVYRATPQHTVHLLPSFSGAHRGGAASIAVGF
jgi:hypothetical protein